MNIVDQNAHLIALHDSAGFIVFKEQVWFESYELNLKKNTSEMFLPDVH